MSSLSTVGVSRGVFARDPLVEYLVSLSEPAEKDPGKKYPENKNSWMPGFKPVENGANSARARVRRYLS